MWAPGDSPQPGLPGTDLSVFHLRGGEFVNLSCVVKGARSGDHSVLYFKHTNSWHSSQKKKKKASYRAFGQTIKEENLKFLGVYFFVGFKGHLGQKLLNVNYRFLLVQYQRNCRGTWSSVLHAVKK